MFLQVSVCPQGGHAWLVGGVCGCRGGMHGCGGVCMVAGGMHGCRGVCMVAGGACVGYHEIWSMSGRYASYWNAFLLQVELLDKLVTEMSGFKQ